MNKAPECWGGFQENGKKCISCPFRDACGLFTATEPAMSRPVGGQDYESIGGWAPDVADHNHIPGVPRLAEEGDIFRDFADFLRFMLSLNDYDLGILAEIVCPEPGKPVPNVAELARRHSISRQGMHRKLLDMARKNPVLSSLLAMTVRKIRKARQEFSIPRPTFHRRLSRA